MNSGALIPGGSRVECEENRAGQNVQTGRARGWGTHRPAGALCSDKIPDIPYHSIIGDRGRGGNLDHTEPVSSDGMVPYWSSHLNGAQSELIIPSEHRTIQHLEGMAEVRRILTLHLR